MTSDALRELVMDAGEVGRRRREQGAEEAPGVRRTALWTHAGSAAGVLEVQPGAELAEHTHASHGHHVWVVSGTAEVLGRTLGPGSYWFVPAGPPHALAAVGDEPCELFYVYEVESP